jgi:hypothetical protein
MGAKIWPIKGLSKILAIQQASEVPHAAQQASEVPHAETLVSPFVLPFVPPFVPSVKISSQYLSLFCLNLII